MREALRCLSAEVEPDRLLAIAAEVVLGAGASWAGAWVCEGNGRFVRVASVGGAAPPTEIEAVVRATVTGVRALDPAAVGLGAWARAGGISQVLACGCVGGGRLRGVLVCGVDRPPDPSRLDAAGMLADLVGGFCAAQQVRREAEAERARLAERLLHLQRLEGVGLLASGVAHDFNNLLAVIVGNASLALNRLEPESAERRLLQDIIGTAQRGEDLTHQLLAYSGNAPVRYETLDIRAQVDAVGALVRAVLPRKVELVKDLSPAWIEADVAQIQQVVLNLVTNAAEATRNGRGRVVLRTGTSRLDADAVDELFPGESRLPGRYAWIEVEDDGVGIPPDLRESLFDPFFTTKGMGRGLGLHAIREIARNHDGVVRLESVPDGGSRFRVWIQAVHAPDDVDAPSLEDSEPGVGLVLLVDDEAHVRATVRLLLEHLGYTVVEAGDGAEALRRVDELGEDITVILLDVSMPVLDGEGMLDVLATHPLRIPVVLSSGYNQNDDIDRISAKGTCTFLPKPYTIQQLARALAQATATAGPRYR